MAAASRGVEPNSFPQLRDRFLVRAAVPEGDTQVVVRICRIRLEGDGTP